MLFRKFSGLVPYQDALTAMDRAVREVQQGAEDECWFLEHPPTYTAGTSAKKHDLLHADFPVFETGRGGQYTYHGPGQRVGYIISDLKRKAEKNGTEPDLRAYVTQIEQLVIHSLKSLGVQGFLRKDRIGVWVNIPSGEAKIAALGVRIQRWVTSHGFALNVHPDLSHYAGIVPCGIAQFGVTSLHALGIKVSMDEVDASLSDAFEAVLGEKCAMMAHG